MTDSTNWETVLLGENLVFTLCGRILYEELDRTWLQSLIDDDILIILEGRDEGGQKLDGRKQVWNFG